MNPFAATVTLSGTKIPLTEPLKVELKLTYPKEYHPDLDGLRSHLAKNFILLTEKISEPAPQEGALTQTLEWTVASETAGPKMVTFYTIPFHAPGKKSVELISDLYPIDIYLPKVDLEYQGELAPLSTFSKMHTLAISEKNIHLESPDYIRQKIAAKTLPLPLLAILAALAALYFIAKWYRERRLEQPIEHKKMEEMAIESLEEIEPLPEEEYFVKMAAVMRRFIQERYRVNAVSQSSQECLKNVSKQLYPEQQNLLRIIFHTADLVNYAHHKPTSKERKSIAHFAKRFIKES